MEPTNDHMKQRLMSVLGKWMPDASTIELRDIVKLMQEQRFKRGLNTETPKIFHLPQPASDECYSKEFIFGLLAHMYKETREDKYGIRRFVTGKVATNTDILNDYIQSR